MRDLLLKSLVLLYVLVFCGVAFASDLECEGDCASIRRGAEIEAYNYSTGESTSLEVESVRDFGHTVEVETYNYQTGEYGTLEIRQ